jgi:DNA-binding transcriptional ArsR family regulator
MAVDHARVRATRKCRVLPDEVLDVVATRMRVIADPTRVRLMWLLDSTGGTTVAELADRMPATTVQNVSKHLCKLFQAGLVRRTRDGGRVRYELVDWTALWVVDQIVSSVCDQIDSQRATFAALAG